MSNSTRAKSLLIFIIVCFAAIIFIFSPLIIRIPLIKGALKHFLGIFERSEYKSVYITTMGSIMGSFLAIAGAVWTQYIFKRGDDRRQTEKNAAIIYYDFKFALDNIREVIKIFYPLARGNTLPEDLLILEKFRKLSKINQIYIDQNWRGLVTNLRDILDSREIRETQILYSKLSLLSNFSSNSLSSEAEPQKNKSAYVLMCSLFSEEFDLKDPSNCNITIKDNISSLLNKLSKIANINSVN